MAIPPLSDSTNANRITPPQPRTPKYTFLRDRISPPPATPLKPFAPSLPTVEEEGIPASPAHVPAAPAPTRRHSIEIDIGIRQQLFKAKAQNPGQGES